MPYSPDLNQTLETDVVCIGAGPAGLTAAYILGKHKKNVIVVEKDEVYNGGISRTVEYKNYLFDIGGHRFFSKNKDVNKLWDEILGEDFLTRPRKSRIFYRKKLFNYPLTPIDTLLKLGVFESAACIISYTKAVLLSVPDPKNFEQWVINKFGRRLFTMFFKTYTEKVWGMNCSDISSDWAAQRIKSFSLGQAIKHAFLPKKKNKRESHQITTLINSFKYPRRGPGMMWDAAASKITSHGNKILKGYEAIALNYDAASKTWEVTCQGNSGTIVIKTSHIISSSPIKTLITSIFPAFSIHSINAANALKYRDFLIVALIVRERDTFDDNWIYIHDPEVLVGRIQNFKSWSEDMIPDQTTNCYGMEYFCFDKDELWSKDNSSLINHAKNELVKLGLAEHADILDGTVIRQPKAYPVYDADYKNHIDTIRKEIADKYANLHLVGRNGMHKYNNQDHAMLTAMLAVENILSNSNKYNLWNVNQDAEYHEEFEALDKGGRLIPEKLNP